MSIKFSQSQSPAVGLKNEAYRQRGELFHRAIAHAQQSNSDAMQQSLSDDGQTKHRRPVLTIAK